MQERIPEEYILINVRAYGCILKKAVKIFK